MKSLKNILQNKFKTLGIIIDIINKSNKIDFPLYFIIDARDLSDKNGAFPSTYNQ